MEIELGKNQIEIEEMHNEKVFLPDFLLKNPTHCSLKCMGMTSLSIQIAIDDSPHFTNFAQLNGKIHYVMTKLSKTVAVSEEQGEKCGF